MEINTTKKDIIWSYISQFFVMGSGLIVLPVILKLLSPEEVGFNYILLSISTIINLFDMGFSGQFARNITYVLSGAQKLEKEGITDSFSENINEQLLATTLYTAKRIYLYISLIAFVPLITLGTFYVWHITDGFTNIDNVLIIWVIFCISCLFNLYYIYLSTFMQGRGLIKDTKQAQVYSRISYIIIAFSLLFSGLGLVSITIANLIAPFVLRYYLKGKFYDEYFSYIRDNYKVSKEQFLDIFRTILHSAKKMGIISVLATAIGQATTLVIGAYLDLAVVSSYGLMVQLVTMITSVSTILYYTLQPQFSSLLAKKSYDILKVKFGQSIFVFLIFQFLGFIAIIISPSLLQLIGSKTLLPQYTVLILYFLYKMSETIQSLYATLLLAANDLCFYRSSVITGIVSFICIFIVLQLGWGLLGVIIIQSFVLYLYVAWKWPIYATKKYNINTKQDIFIRPLKNFVDVIYKQV